MAKTIAQIRAHKNQDVALVCLTAYTAPMAHALSPAVDFLLVGDSVGTTLYGMENTLGVDLEMMIRHGQAVIRGRRDSVPVVIDMPAGSYEDSANQALASARRIVEETGCDAVKLEGGLDMIEQIRAITDAGIDVMGHIGLMPQSVEKEGCFKIKGKTPEQVAMLIADASAVEDAGAFSVVIEGTIENVAETITREISIPTIGIGASVACDGQVLVCDDMLGLTYGHVPKFARRYAQLGQEIEEAAAAFAEDVRARRFPSAEYTYQAPASSGAQKKIG